MNLSRSIVAGAAFIAMAGLLGSGRLALAEENAALRRPDGLSVPVIAYAPATASCRGIALISPGAGGSEQGYRYLGEGVAALGYLAVVIGHPESGRQALQAHLQTLGLRDALARLISTPEAYRGRAMDVDIAGQWAAQRCAPGERILLGHSMGAATVMMDAGARNKMGIAGTRAFDAYVALSPQGQGLMFPADAWTAIDKPVLLITGTLDGEIGGADWRARTEPFTNMPPGCKWLGVIDGATHMHFAGRGDSRRTEAATIAAIRVFLDGVRRRDCGLSVSVDGIGIDVR